MSKTIKTTTGHEWRLNSDNSATDLGHGGLTWFPKENGTFTYDKIKDFKHEFKRIPTAGELRIAWEHGLMEVFEDDNNFWSSSVTIDFYPIGVFFCCFTGRWKTWSSDILYVRLRCVKRSG